MRAVGGFFALLSPRDQPTVSRKKAEFGRRVKANGAMSLLARASAHSVYVGLTREAVVRARHNALSGVGWVGWI